MECSLDLGWLPLGDRQFLPNLPRKEAGSEPPKSREAGTNALIWRDFDRSVPFRDVTDLCIHAPLANALDALGYSYRASMLRVAEAYRHLEEVKSVSLSGESLISPTKRVSVRFSNKMNLQKILGTDWRIVNCGVPFLSRPETKRSTYYTTHGW